MTLLEQLQVALDATTPGEWVVDHWNHNGDGQNGGTVHVGDVDADGFLAFDQIVLEADCDNYVKSVGPDLDFIALAHNHMAALLRIARAAQGVIDNWEHGDLAGAVNYLDGCLDELREETQ